MGYHVKLAQLGPVTITTSLTTIGTVQGIKGAKALIVEIFGGDNAANSLSLIAATPCGDLAGTLVPVGDVGATGAGSGLTNRAEGAGLFCTIVSTAADGEFHTECATIKATMATAQSAGCRVNVWAAF